MVKIYAVTFSTEELIIGLEQFPLVSARRLQQTQAAQDMCAIIIHFVSVALLDFCLFFVLFFFCVTVGILSVLQCFNSHGYVFSSSVTAIL